MNNIIVDRVEIGEDKSINSLVSNVYDIKKNVTLIINLDSFKYDNCEFNLDENAHLIINKMYNEKEVNEIININLNGLNSRIDYNFSTLTDCDQSFVINVNHNNKNTSSYVKNHGVVINDSKLEFIVNSNVKKGNNKSILKQESKIIVMSLNNSIIKPNLFIDEFDVEAIHSATIGRFSKDEIFYLMTKGISKEDATNLLIKGFLEGHVKEVNYER